MRRPMLTFDVALVEKITPNDEKSFMTIYEHLNSYLYSLALRIVGNVSDTEEIVQEAFLKIWSNAEKYDDAKGSMLTWASSITRRQAIDKTRSRAYKNQDNEVKLEASELGRVKTDGYENSRDSVIKKEDAQIVCRALNTLPEDCRKIIELAYYSRYTQSHIAKMLDMPLGTVKTKLRRGILHLKEELKGKLSR